MRWWLFILLLCVAAPVEARVVVKVRDVDHATHALAARGTPALKAHHWNQTVVVADASVAAAVPGAQFSEEDLVWGVHQDTPQWGVLKVRADHLWPSGTGAGIDVYVIDTGIDCTHPDLAPDCVDEYNAITPGASAFDDFGHGTHVAGIIAARLNGAGVVGVAPGAILHACKALDARGAGFLSDVAECIAYTTAHGGRVINLSLGGQFSQVVADAIMQADAAGVLVVASAGNSGCCDTVAYPGALPEVVGVGATDVNDQIASFSSSGREVDVSAPGVNVVSTVPTGSCPLCDPSGYRSLSGTSMAAPHVAGAGAALMARGFTNQEAKALLENGGIDLGAPGWDFLYGFGRIDLPTALTASTVPPEPGSSDTTPPSASVTAPAAGTIITIAGPVIATASGSDASGPVFFDFYRFVEVNGVPQNYFLCRVPYGGDSCAFAVDSSLNGTWVLRVFAWDSYDNFAYSDSPLTVAIGPPPPPPPPPPRPCWPPRAKRCR